MNIKSYNLTNWKTLLEKDWDWFREDFGSANMENVIDNLLHSAHLKWNKEMREMIGEDEETRGINDDWIDGKNELRKELLEQLEGEK